MNPYISRKRRKVSSTTIESTENSLVESGLLTKRDREEDEESTEIKIATLASLFPDVDQGILLDSLIAENGSVSAVCQALHFSEKQDSSRKSSVVGHQSSLISFRIGSANTRLKPLTRKGQTLHLYTPEDIAAHTPCSIIHNFLPVEEADALLRELLKEAFTFERQTFKLFDNVVQSPHSACFYVDSLEEETRQKTEYLYNGSFLTVWLRSKSMLNNSMTSYLLIVPS